MARTGRPRLENPKKNPAEIDGMSGFAFTNRFGSVPNPQSINRAIKRICADYSADEEIAAKREHRDPLLLSCLAALRSMMR